MNNNKADFSTPENSVESSQDMLFRLRKSLTPKSETTTPPVLDNVVEPMDSSTYSQQEIIYALTQLQGSHEISVARNQGQPNEGLIRSKILEKIGRRQGDVAGKKIHKSDATTIRIVSKMFNYILDDPGLPGTIKLLLVQLQVPMIKVAILDNKFFALRSHPARLLLNELAMACSGMESINRENESIYQMVRYIVSRITSEYDRDAEIFANMLKVFTQFTERERKSNKLAEEMMEEARDHVAREMKDRITSNRLPPLVENILVDAWKDVLIHLYLRDGKDSESWRTALKVADDLIWSVQPKLIVNERSKLINKIPAILNGLRDGLTLIHFDLQTTSKMFADLEELHLASIRGDLPDNLPKTPSGPAQPEMIDIDHTSLNLTEDDFGIDLSSFPGSDDDIITNVEASRNALQSSRMSEQEKQDLQFSQYSDIIQNMKLGTWVKFINTESGNHYRGKLAWRCDFTEEFTFVDNNYKVVEDLTFRKLLEKFETSRASIVDDIPLFDRALDAVIVDMKSSAN
ncbi:DUF1631 family protein [Kaarinaea lacus]